GLGELVGEGQSAYLVCDHSRCDLTLGQLAHGAHEVGAVTDHPGGAHDVVLRHSTDHCVTGCFGLPVDAKRRDRVVLPVRPRCSAVEHVVAGHVHEGDAVSGSNVREFIDGGDVH